MLTGQGRAAPVKAHHYVQGGSVTEIEVGYDRQMPLDLPFDEFPYCGI